jgi:hypothetical protein
LLGELQANGQGAQGVAVCEAELDRLLAAFDLDQAPTLPLHPLPSLVLRADLVGLTREVERPPPM